MLLWRLIGVTHLLLANITQNLQARPSLLAVMSSRTKHVSAATLPHQTQETRCIGVHPCPRLLHRSKCSKACERADAPQIIECGGNGGLTSLMLGTTDKLANRKLTLILPSLLFSRSDTEVLELTYCCDQQCRTNFPHSSSLFHDAGCGRAKTKVRRLDPQVPRRRGHGHRLRARAGAGPADARQRRRWRQLGAAAGRCHVGGRRQRSGLPAAVGVATSAPATCLQPPCARCAAQIVADDGIFEHVSSYLASKVSERSTWCTEMELCQARQARADSGAHSFGSRQ